MFRKTIDCKGGDKGNIADYSRNLLHRMAHDAQPFGVFYFIWLEIRSVGERPLKGYGFAPYIMFMIENIVDDLTEIGVPPAGPGGGAAAPEADSPAGGAAAG